MSETLRPPTLDRRRRPTVWHKALLINGKRRPIPLAVSLGGAEPRFIEITTKNEAGDGQRKEASGEARRSAPFANGQNGDRPICREEILVLSGYFQLFVKFLCFFAISQRRYRHKRFILHAFTNV
jgi:hypothetical protein